MKETRRSRRGIILQTCWHTLTMVSSQEDLCAVPQLWPTQSHDFSILNPHRAMQLGCDERCQFTPQGVGQLRGPCTPGCKHTELAALASPCGGEEQHSSSHLLRCLQCHQRYSLKWQAGQVEGSRQVRENPYILAAHSAAQTTLLLTPS